MAKRVELTGQVFGRLTVLEYDHKGKAGHAYWKCICECGNIIVTAMVNLKSGKSNSCGCLQKEELVKRSLIHGDSKSRLYRTFRGMKSRCNDKRDIHYKNYGGRGITVCDEWQNYTNFKEWSINNGYNNTLTIDRIDVNGNYEPSNCRWVTNEVQKDNKQNTIYLTYNKETKSLSEWSKEKNLKKATIMARLKRGYNIERALNEKIKNPSKNKRQRNINDKIKKAYYHMKDRCYNQKTPSYENYGGRGIRICQEWLNDYKLFKQWALDNGCKIELSLDRIDVNKDYSPGNCRWTNREIQANNKRNNYLIEYNGETKTISQWSKDIGLKTKTIKNRIDRGWTIEESLTTPLLINGRRRKLLNK